MSVDGSCGAHTIHPLTYFIHLPVKIELTVSSETSAIRIQTPGNYPKRTKLHLEHGERLKTRLYIFLLLIYRVFMKAKSWKKIFRSTILESSRGRGKKSDAVYCILTSYLLYGIDM